jgi:tRNA pseudouridine38-40 synthase
MRYVIQLAYKGTNYHGWQKQHNAVSVQSILDEKISLLQGENIETLGCGRTDTGVHAKNFYAHFDSTKIITPDIFVHKINQLLPNDIVVFEVLHVADDFNARFDAVSRTYEYWIIQKQNPFLIGLSLYQYRPLDIERMNIAAESLIGTKNFECFSRVQTQVNNFICTIEYAQWTIEDDKLIFTIRANRFLRSMVRAIVGSLLEIGKGKLPTTNIQYIIDSKKRSEAGQSAPAKGLYLTQIEYPNLPLK